MREIANDARRLFSRQVEIALQVTHEATHHLVGTTAAVAGRTPWCDRRRRRGRSGSSTSHGRRTTNVILADMSRRAATLVAADRDDPSGSRIIRFDERDVPAFNAGARRDAATHEHVTGLRRAGDGRAPIFPIAGDLWIGRRPQALRCDHRRGELTTPCAAAWITVLTHEPVDGRLTAGQCCRCSARKNTLWHLAPGAVSSFGCSTAPRFAYAWEPISLQHAAPSADFGIWRRTSLCLRGGIGGGATPRAGRPFFEHAGAAQDRPSGARKPEEQSQLPRA